MKRRGASDPRYASLEDRLKVPHWGIRPLPPFVTQGNAWREKTSPDGRMVWLLRLSKTATADIKH
jgi:hypothetical protein